MRQNPGCKKGYTYTKTDASYLGFTDNDEIATWAKPDIAVAIRCGLLGNSGAFAPTDTVTRAEGAEMLYKTFMLLYDVSPITTVSSENAEAPEEPQQAGNCMTLNFVLRSVYSQRLSCCSYAIWQ